MGVGGLLHGLSEGLERDLQASVLVLFLGRPLPVYFEVFDGLPPLFLSPVYLLEILFLSLEGFVVPEEHTEEARVL